MAFGRDTDTAGGKTRGKTGGPERRLGQEALGIVLLALTALLAVSLLSYSVEDPSWTSSGVQRAAPAPGMPAPPPEVHNLAGTAGAHLADGVLQLIGGCAYLLPFLLFGFGVAALRGGEVRGSWPRAAGWGVFFLAAPGLMDLWFSTVWTIGDGKILFGRAGGVVGEVLTSLLLPLFAPVGTTIVLVTLFLIGTVMGPALTLGRVGARALKAWKALAETLSDTLAERREAARERRRQRVSPAAVRRQGPRSATRTARPKIVEPEEPAPAPAQESLSFMRSKGTYQLPPLSLLADPGPAGHRISDDELVASSHILEKKLADYGVEGKVTQVHPGPVVTMYEFAPAPGVKVSKIASLADDLALAMSATRVRIVAPIPGKSVVGIEIPNLHRETVALKELFLSSQFTEGGPKIPLALGKDIFGAPVVADLADMPHLLVAGSTGSGKSVGLNAMILSIAYSATPAEVKLAMIDPKMLELSAYDGIPHLIHPVITRPKDAVKLLHRMVVEMMTRYKLMQQAAVRNVEGYNEAILEPDFTQKTERWREAALEAGETPLEHRPLPYIVVVIDELADLMAVAAKEIEEPIARLAQMARAAGIHLILATQRPSVDVITGLIKANFPSRVAYQVSSKTDSRTILDMNGAEQLLGKGDMLFIRAGTSAPRRIHGPFVSDAEVHKVVAFVKGEQPPQYDPELLSDAQMPADLVGPASKAGDEEERDEVYDQAVRLVAQTGKASASFLQRRIRVGYPRAARIIEMMEEDGIVGPADGARPREVLIRPEPGEHTL
jgi:S-DNA-T family DNA segregation ATPase FtsK/SpoIIIE